MRITESFMLRLEPIPGSDIERVLQSAKHISKLNNVIVAFNFNGKRFVVSKNSNIQEKLKSYNQRTAT